MAAGLHHFLTAPSAPKKVKNAFGAQNVIAPPGIEPAGNLQ
jgi:hypothetical protein